MQVQVNFSLGFCVFGGLLIAVYFVSNAMVVIVLGFGGGRRGFSSGFRRDYDGREGDRYGDREERLDRRDDGREERGTLDDVNAEITHFSFKDTSLISGMLSLIKLDFILGPPQRPKLNLKPRSIPKEEEQSGSLPPQSNTANSSRASSIFGAAKPVDTAAKEREVEERLKKEQERLQKQLEEDKNRASERRPRDR